MYGVARVLEPVPSGAVFGCFCQFPVMLGIFSVVFSGAIELDLNDGRVPSSQDAYSREAVHPGWGEGKSTCEE